MVQYAELNLATSMNVVPGMSQMYRLPVMMPGKFHITATGHSIAHFSPPVVISRARDGLVGGLGGGVVIGPTEPPLPPPYSISLDIFHGDQLVASGAPPPLQQSVSDMDGTWRVRVNYPDNAQPTDTVQFNLMPYTSTLPILTRRIPLWFLQQGFNNNWNGREYISIAFENSTLYIRFDPEIASYYHLSEQDIAVATVPTEVPPDMMVKDIQLRIDSSSGGYEEQPGPLPYIQVTVSVGGIDNQPMNFDILGGHFTISDFSIVVKFYVIAAPGVVEGAMSTVVGYRSEVTTDLLNKIAATNDVGDIIAWIADGTVHSLFYNSVLPDLRTYLDSRSGVVGAAITPWLLGAAYTVWDVRYDPASSQPLPASGPDKPWVPQGDIVVTYIGLAATAGPSGLGFAVAAAGPSGLIARAPAVVTVTPVAPDGIIGMAYTLALSAFGGTEPYAWSISGTLPPGLALAGSMLAGVPTAQGVYTFQANVTDANGIGGVQAFSVAVNAPDFTITTSSPLPQAVAGDAYAQVFTAAGGAGPLTWSATGLPAGLSMSAKGVMSGTPTGDGSLATIVVQALDIQGNIASHAFVLKILDPLLFGEQRYTPRGAGTSMYRPPKSAGGFIPGPGLPKPAVSQGNLSKIDHIVVLMMENRSFDHMLGYLSREGARSDVEGLKWENDSNRTQYNFYNGLFYYPNRLIETHLFNPESIGPDHSFESVKAQMTDNMGHFVSDYARNKIHDNNPAQLSQVMGYYTGEQLPTYARLAREFAICDNWFCSHPGPTWPNRFITLTGDLNLDSYGEAEVDTPLYSDFTPSEATTIFDLLTERNVSWQYFEQRVSTIRAYTKYTFDLVNVLEYSDPVQGFAASVKAGLKSVTFVDPLFGDLPAGINAPQDNDDAPPSDLADGQRFVAEVVSTLFTPASNPNWERTMLLIVYDEHGGFYDHVQPPADAVPLTGQSSGKLGPRVPAFVVSPRTPAGLVLKERFDHASIAATILNRFCAPHPPFLSARVSAARDLRDALPLDTVRELSSPLVGVATEQSQIFRRRVEPRPFRMKSASDSFGSLLGAMALMLGKGGG